MLYYNLYEYHKLYYNLFTCDFDILQIFGIHIIIDTYN